MNDHIDSETSAEASVRDGSPTISDFRMRWFSIVVVIVMTVVMIGAVMIANPHHPQVQWPDSECAELRYLGSQPVDSEYLEEVLKLTKFRRVLSERNTGTSVGIERSHMTPVLTLV